MNTYRLLIIIVLFFGASLTATPRQDAEKVLTQLRENSAQLPSPFAQTSERTIAQLAALEEPLLRITALLDNDSLNDISKRMVHSFILFAHELPTHNLIALERHQAKELRNRLDALIHDISIASAQGLSNEVACDMLAITSAIRPLLMPYFYQAGSWHKEVTHDFKSFVYHHPGNALLTVGLVGALIIMTVHHSRV